MLADKIKEDLKISLKSGAMERAAGSEPRSSERAGVLRLLLAEVQNKEKEKFGGKGGALSDEDALAVFQKEAKKRREAIELFKKGNRDDLVKKDEAELVVIEEFLPKQLTQEEIRAAIDKLAVAGVGDFNSLMKEAMKELKGRADGRTVGEIIKEKLNS